jgi:hypothetical protein
MMAGDRCSVLTKKAPFRKGQVEWLCFAGWQATKSAGGWQA